MMKKPKVLFIDSVHPVLAERLEEKGYACDWKTEYSREDILKIIAEYEGAVIRSKFKFDQEVIDAAGTLKWIARSGAGMENIDVEYAKKKGIRCYNSPEGNRDAVAEHAIGMLLSLFNHLSRSDQEVRQGIWQREKNRGVELKGKTVGILGYGYMGEAFAQRLRGFEVSIIAYDKYKSGFGNEWVQEVSEEELFEQTDVLSIHLPLTKETTFMIDSSYLDRFAKSIYLINTARGKNLKTRDLLKAIERGKVLGACLDVLEFESTSFEKLSKEDLPEDFRELTKSDKVILSPHVAGWTVESYEKLSLVLADKILG
jgi:D-3-phosphoglycerate dehydrogenase